MTTDYEPKHMIDKEATLDRWQAQTATAAALLHPGVHQNTGNDMMVRTLLSIMSESRELLGMFYDFGDNETYEPKHLTTPLISTPKHVCPECGGKAVITKRVCFGPNPHNEYRCTKCRWTGCNTRRPA